MLNTQQDEILALIARNLAGVADQNEVTKLNDWINFSRSNRKYFEQVRNIWEASDRQVDTRKINSAEALTKVLARLPKEKRERKFWSTMQKIAAVIILPLAGAALLWTYMEINSEKESYNDLVYNEVYAPYGTRSSFRLADSSLVWLNSGSRLKYPVRFSRKNRTVFLDGEAYFEVESNKSKPFIVQTSSLRVKSTGTKFNVSEYRLNPLTEVTLTSGKISVSNGNDNKNYQLISEMSPNQHLVYNSQTREKKLLSEDTYQYVAWKDGKLMFRNEPLDKVLDKISLMFNVDIELRGKELQNYRYHATFKDESLEEILKLLKLSAPIGYTELVRTPLPDGSFPKKKVIIYPVRQTKTIKPN
jgi:transmembrane sensor